MQCLSSPAWRLIFAHVIVQGSYEKLWAAVCLWKVGCTCEISGVRGTMLGPGSWHHQQHSWSVDHQLFPHCTGSVLPSAQDTVYTAHSGPAPRACRYLVSMIALPESRSTAETTWKRSVALSFIVLLNMQIREVKHVLVKILNSQTKPDKYRELPILFKKILQ